MNRHLSIVLIVFVGLMLLAGPVRAESIDPAAGSVQLSPGLRDLLRAEMREITAGVQGIALSIASADWRAIEETSAAIRASYILERQLTPAQAEELESVLPERFKMFDAGFHQRADKIGAAAAARDIEQVIFHYSRLIESCAVCHGEFAHSRFPGFTSSAGDAHHH